MSGDDMPDLPPKGSPEWRRLRDAFKRASNEARGTPRWTAIAYYRTENGLIDVTHDFHELSDLDDLMERGPSWLALDRIEIRPNGYEPMTIEQSERE